MNKWRTVPDTQTGLTTEEIESFVQEGLERLKCIQSFINEQGMPADPLTISALATIVVRLFTSRYREDFGSIIKLMAMTWQNETEQEVVLLPVSPQPMITVPESGKVH